MHPRIAVLVVVLLSACRDATEPFESRDVGPVADELRRLTFNPADDRSPEWSRGSDTVYYSTSASEYVAESFGVLMAVPARGGTARPLLATQDGRALARHLFEPSRAPGEEPLAFVEMRTLAAEAPCDFVFTQCQLGREWGPSPALQEAWLGVVPEADAPGQWTEVAHLSLDGAPKRVGKVGAIDLYESRFDPIQEAWLTRRALPFKPAWSPTADRIAIVDGNGVRVIDLATGASTTVATGDVANPAWSPDGAWIAFDRVERVDSVADMCLYEVPHPKGGPNAPICWERRMFYTTTPPVVERVRPDGSEAQILAGGGDPAWSPDGSRLYYVARGAIIERILSSGAERAVPGTEGGEEPAVSPDGSDLAFTRFDAETGTRDVWAVRLADDQAAPVTSRTTRIALSSRARTTYPARH